MKTRPAVVLGPVLLVLATPAAALTPILFVQSGSCASSYTPSQELEPLLTGQTSQAADDVEVAAEDHGWQVVGLEIDGTYTIPSVVTAAAVNVFFYRSTGGLPGSPVAGCQYEDLTSFTDNSGDLSISLSPFCVLPPSADSDVRYWLSVQARLDSENVGGNRWYWRDRTAQTFAPAAWRNPGDHLATDCEAWGRRAVDCEINPSTLDQCFTLYGYHGLFSSGFELGGVSLWSDSLVN